MDFEHLFWGVLIRPLQGMHRVMYAVGKTDILGRIVLLLTTTGRKSGRRRITPLQYSELDGLYYVASSRGCRADWFRNLQADPQVQVQVDKLQFGALAEPVTDSVVIADYLQGVIDRHPRMGAAMMHLHRLPSHPSRTQLEQLAARLALVILHPQDFSRN
jgi:deazaflavin-dependent oxidoreductase (nitroreductase family)